MIENINFLSYETITFLHYFWYFYNILRTNYGLSASLLNSKNKTKLLRLKMVFLDFLKTFLAIFLELLALYLIYF